MHFYRKIFLGVVCISYLGSLNAWHIKLLYEAEGSNPQNSLLTVTLRVMGDIEYVHMVKHGQWITFEEKNHLMFKDLVVKEYIFGQTEYQNSKMPTKYFLPKGLNRLGNHNLKIQRTADGLMTLYNLTSKKKWKKIMGPL